MCFRSPKVPSGFSHSTTQFTQPSAELVAGQWAGEANAEPVTFELLPLGKQDLLVHEWGVFAVFNDVKYANADSKEEWSSLPALVYRQFPKERLRWSPAKWSKPIVYFYAKPSPLQLTVTVTFTEGAPVVWWPAVASPLNDGGSPSTGKSEKPRPFRSLTWEAWLGDKIPPMEERRRDGPMFNVADFMLPADCWLQQARLSGASRITVVGNIEQAPRRLSPTVMDRLETERFLFYDGLVPAPDYLRCKEAERTSLRLHNRAKFDITRLFVVDRRVKGTVGFASVQGKNQPFRAATSLKIELTPVAPENWPATGAKQVRQALLDAGLFEPEADALVTIWRQRLLEAGGLTAFHILPADEYERMLALDIVPAPASKPVRVGIACIPTWKSSR